MLGNHLKIGYRSMLNNKLFSILNILGLSVGIAAFIIVFLYVREELSVDRFNEHYQDIYRLEIGDWFNVPAPLFPLMREHMSGLEAVTPVDLQSMKAEFDNKTFQMSNVIFTDPDFFTIFTIEMIYGNGIEALQKPNTILLSASEAKRLFGDENPIDKTLLIDETHTFTIAGVFHDFTHQSTLKCNSLSAFSNRKTMMQNNDFFENWENWNYQAFLRLTPKADANAVVQFFNAELNKVMVQTGERESEMHFSLRQLHDVYFYRDINKYDFCNHGNKQYLILFGFSAILTLLIAIINFINLSTARSGLRSKEIGIRKICGAEKKDIVRQFMGESFFLTAIAFLIAITFTELLLPHFSKIVQKDIVFDFFVNPNLFLYLITGLFFISILAGIYPAFYMASIRLLSILKRENIRGKGGLYSRRILLTVQFIITIILLLGTITIYKQMWYITSKDVGFDKEQIIYFHLNKDLRNNVPVMREKLLQHPQIAEASFIHSLPGNVLMQWGRNMDNGTNVNFFCIPCDEFYLPLLNLTFLEGRNFDPNLESDKGAYIINKTFAKTYNLEQPLNETTNGKKIVGVVEDFAFQSLHNPNKPMAFVYMTSWNSWFAVKFSENQLESAKNIILDTVKDLTDDVIAIRFLEDSIQQLYIEDYRFRTIFTVLSVLAIIISCLGLIGLISFESNRRYKEIAIRKVMGSSVIRIFTLLNRELLILLSISSVIAWFLGYLIFSRWLENFAFSVKMAWDFYFVSTMITAFVSFFTFSILVWKAANSNPVMVLKYE
jgi:putative ABC transport system permease protein